MTASALAHPCFPVANGLLAREIVTGERMPRRKDSR
jgi:hypothetical protein